MPSSNKKRWSAWVCCLLVAAGPCAGADWVLRAGTPAGLPGYALDANGNLVIEAAATQQLLGCIEKTLNARFVWQALPTRRLTQMVTSAQLDIAFPMGFTPERARLMRQSAAAWDSRDVWLSQRPVNVDDKTLRLAARLGSPAHTELATEGYAKVVASTTYAELPRVLELNMADAVVMPQWVYDEHTPAWPKDTVITLGRARSSGFYLPANDPKRLAARLDQAIQRCRAAAK